MKKLTIQEIANATHARILAANLEEAQQKTICHVTQDSRQAGEESLFVPLKGKNSDGHDYLKSCMEKGVAACFTEREMTPENGCVLLLVENARGGYATAWQNIIAAYLIFPLWASQAA